MRRHRRMVLMDRVIPFLAAVVGLLALAGAVLVQISVDTRSRETAAEVVALRESIDALERKTAELAQTDEALAAADNDGTIEALLALQERVKALEGASEERAVTASAGISSSDGGSYATAAGAAPAEIDPSWPTTDCIPLGTRFMASTGDSIAICRTPVVVKVSAITGDNVFTENAGVINETASQAIPGTNCSLMVFSAEAEGFAEMRVSCQ
jgi:acyl-CoA synthetase (AMP-forming)/AMP-acid ligase II